MESGIYLNESYVNYVDEKVTINSCIPNLYNRKNIWSIEWVKQKNQTRKTYGLGITPIAGFHIEF